jgi:RHS repeat-associated protein
VVTDDSGNVCYDADYYPFQGERAYVTTCAPAYRFAGMKFDQESSDYYTLNRYYPPNLGRWLSPDPVAGSIYNPQSLNRYAYVLNNPMNFIDPLGLHDQLPKGWECVPSDEDCQGVRPPRCNNMTCVWEYWRSTICSINGHWGPCPSWDWEIGKTDRGNDIFDALAGAPGTYLTLDMHGNLGFGFDEGLWMQTWAFIDTARAQGSTPPTAGYLVHQVWNPILSAASRTVSENVTRYGFIPSLSGAIDSVRQSGGSMRGPYVTIAMEPAGVNMKVYTDTFKFTVDPILGPLDYWMRTLLSIWFFP